MIKTLQFKFVKTAMTAITVLLLVVICAISGLYTFNAYRNVLVMGRMLAENGGIPVPRDDMTQKGVDWSEDTSGDGSGERAGGDSAESSGDGSGERAGGDSAESSGDGSGERAGGDSAESSGDGSGENSGDGFKEGPAGPQEGRSDWGNAPSDHNQRGFFRDNRAISPDKAMASRFFLVRFTQDGEIDYTDTSKIYSVSTQEADEMAREVYESGRQSGIRDRFFYFANESGTEKTVVFMDISSELSSVISVIVISLIIAVICWILMFVLVTVLSRRAIAPIAENIVRQKQFVTNAGHELKTPLAIIMANTEALELFGGESKWTRNIKSQTQRLSVLMQNLLTLSKMDETDLNLPMEEFDLGELVRETAMTFEESAREKKIEYHVELPDITVRANKETMRQLFNILIDNAVKYTPQGGEIRLTAEKEGRYVLFRECNTINPEDAEEDVERLFDRFYRRDGARTQKKGGYGIGLSAARAIAAANKAEISAEYLNRENIVFTVRIVI